MCGVFSPALQITTIIIIPVEMSLTYSSDGDDDNETFGGEESPLLRARESDLEKLVDLDVGYKRPSWWQRRNKICQRLTNRGCCLWTLTVFLAAILIVGIPLFVLFVVPTAIRRTIDAAPPIKLHTIDVKRFYAENKSVGIWLQADLPLKGIIDADFSAAEFDVSLIPPGAKNYHLGGTPLGQFSMQPFKQTKSSGVHLDFFTLYHDINQENVKNVLRMALEYLKNQLSNDIFGVNRAKETVWRLHLDGRPDVSIFGWLFHRVRVFYNIMLDFGAKKLASGLRPKLESCRLGNDEENTMPCSDFDFPVGLISMMNMSSDIYHQSEFSVDVLDSLVRKNDDDDDDGDGDGSIIALLNVSFVNPTSLAFDFGALNSTLYHVLDEKSKKEEELLKIVIPQMKITKTLERQALAVKVIVSNAFYAMSFINKWKNDKLPSKILRMPGNSFEIGYSHDASNNLVSQSPIQRIEWLENVLRDFEFTFNLPNFPLKK